jgi:hypothetical protein
MIVATVHLQFTLIHPPSIVRIWDPCDCAARRGDQTSSRELSSLELVNTNSLEASMKSRTSLLLLILALAASSTLTAHASGCTNRTIKGAWVQNLQGLIFLPDGTSLVLTGVTKTTYDGLGNSTELDASGVNGNVPAGWRTGSGSYTVNPDCTGTETISFPGQADIHAQFVVAQSGNKLHYVNIDAGISLSGEAERLNAPKCEERH